MKAGHSRPAKHLRHISGELTTANFDRFSEIIFDELDSVVGLDLYVTRDDDSGYKSGELRSSVEDGTLTVCKADDDGGAEILVNGNLSAQLAMWRANGFFLVKSGGMNQGIVSAGLSPVDEAIVRLNSGLQIVRVRLSDRVD
jgi:hypothetical protein